MQWHDVVPTWHSITTSLSFPARAPMSRTAFINAVWPVRMTDGHPSCFPAREATSCTLTAEKSHFIRKSVMEVRGIFGCCQEGLERSSSRTTVYAIAAYIGGRKSTQRRLHVECFQDVFKCRWEVRRFVIILYWSLAEWHVLHPYSLRVSN
jgi:hypothetical protein